MDAWVVESNLASTIGVSDCSHGIDVLLPGVATWTWAFSEETQTCDEHSVEKVLEGAEVQQRGILLLWVIGAVAEEAREEPTANPITTCHKNAMDIRMHELLVEE